MQIFRITALDGQGDFGPIHGLPLNGTVPEGTTRSFTVQSPEDAAEVLTKLKAAKTAGKITYSVSSDANDEGARVYKRTLQITHEDLDAVAVSQTIVDPVGAFPAGARLLGYRKQLDTEFAGGGAGSCVIDAGFNGATDELDDGQDIFTGAGTGETFGAGGNAVPEQPRDLGGLTLQATITANVNVALLTAGDLTLEVLYVVHGS